MGTSALGGYVVAQTATFAVTAAQAGTADAVLGTIYVPNNAIIHDVIVQATDMDSNGAPAHAIDVGDSAGPATPDDNRFVAALATGAGGANHAAAASGNLLEDIVYQYVNDATNYPQNEQAIEITNQTAAATGAAGTITLTVIYHAP